MKKKWKIVLAIVISWVLLLLGVIGYRLYWITQHSEEFTVAGTEFGKARDNAACLQEALVRYKQDRSWGGAFAARTFLEDCLEASHPTPGFCDNVPREKDVMKMFSWISKQCSDAGLAGGNDCRKFFGIVQEYCEKSSRQDN